MTLTVLVTGANGFVGRALTRRLADAGHLVRAATRHGTAPPGAAETVAIGDIGPSTDWRPALSGVDVVVHLAGRTHQMRETVRNSLTVYRVANTYSAIRLALHAVKMGVGRLVFLSSAAVLGDISGARPFTEADPPAPPTPFALSKIEAERELVPLGRERGLAVTIVRPPPVFGPGVHGYFLGLMRAIQRGLPLPLAAIDNRCSLIGVRNLADLLCRCVEAPAAANDTFLVSDDAPLATPELVRRIGFALGRPARLFAMPPSLVRGAVACLGGREAARCLTSSLAVDTGKTRSVLGWVPSISTDDELAAMAAWFRETAGR